MLLILYRNKCNFETTKSSSYIFQFYVDCSSSSNKNLSNVHKIYFFWHFIGYLVKKGGLLKRWENILCKFSGYHQLGQPPPQDKKERRNSQIQLFRVQNRDGTLLFLTVQTIKPKKSTYVIILHRMITGSVLRFVVQDKKVS